ncbi:fatty acid--CoA ligase family protein [Streptomyces sp. B1866]|uniref:class I adenylate-forming enzyme family protein n=1 Tax=Streptomyces sp. B1866 TaxID=3075431 RepID=UPI00288DB9BD|nr:fatty acid--CoA ligase family protein [Streptomyces sp. B1866]MDT3396392.1 fatty acid--CoA ligase family protein [Streptomyces sp. B1866]
MAGGMRDLVGRLLDAHPGATPCLVHHDGTHSRAEVRDAVSAEAAVFAGHGIGEGHTVMLRVPPSCTQFEALLALWRLGAQVMLVDHRLKDAEVDGLRALCRPQYLVAAGLAGRPSLGFRARYELVTTRCADGRAAATGHRLVQFSSGSTGLPKVIGRTADSLAAEVERFTRIEGMPARGERVLLLSSTAHSFGLIAGLLHSLAAGVTVVFARHGSARDMLAAAARHDVHVVFGTPFHYELLSTARELPALPALRAAVSGGEIMPPETAARFAERFGVGVGESYGTTETGVVAMDVSGAARPSVGRAAPGVRLRIRAGELEVRLPDGSPYLLPPGGDRYADGWLRTYDRAELAPDGAVRLLGRGDSLVVVGGLKLDLGEVETVLRGHPGVTGAVVVHAGVTEAYVSTRADGGPSAGDLLRWCRERLADYKVPRAVRILPDLPRTSNGKLVRRRDALLALAPDR